MRPHRCGGCWHTFAALEGHVCPHISAPLAASPEDRHRAVDLLVIQCTGCGQRIGGDVASVWPAHFCPGPPARVGRQVGDGKGCDQCHRDRPDLFALYTPEREYGFCSAACLAVWTRTHLVECRRDYVADA